MCCTFACFHRILLFARLLRSAHTEPHQVVGEAAARANANTILDYLKSYLEKCTRALILDQLAPMTLQEHFANSFPSA